MTWLHSDRRSIGKSGRMFDSFPLFTRSQNNQSVTQYSLPFLLQPGHQNIKALSYMLLIKYVSDISKKDIFLKNVAPS